jgi:hypothetical protein
VNHDLFPCHELWVQVPKSLNLFRKKGNSCGAKNLEQFMRGKIVIKKAQHKAFPFKVQTYLLKYKPVVDNELKTGKLNMSS